jgi:DNA-binding MarR family transcriptional regulator
MHSDPLGRRAAREEDAATRIVETLHRIFQHVERFSRASLRRFGVAGSQIWALRTLQESGDLTVGELARRMFLHISTVSGIIDRLEKAKLIHRKRSRPDRRVVRLTLTDAGRAVLRRAPEPPRRRVSLGLQRLGKKDLQRLSWAVGKLADLMGLPDGQNPLF